MRSYEYFKSNKSIPLYFYPFFLIKGFFNLIESILRNLSGPFGLLIRRFYYRLVFERMGNVINRYWVIFTAPQNVICGNRVWFDAYYMINTPIDKIIIGNQVHIGPYCIWEEKINLMNFTAITCGSKVFSVVQIFH